MAEDPPTFETMLAQIPSVATDVTWLEDDFVAVSPQEARDGLREAMALAREQGWIPKDDPGCQCLVCSMFRSYVNG